VYANSVPDPATRLRRNSNLGRIELLERKLRMLNQTRYLVPDSGPGIFGALQEISLNRLPPAFRFSARFSF